MGRLQIQVLGGFAVQTDQGWVGPREMGGGKPRQVLEVLVLARGAAVSKSRIVDLLWGEAAPRDVVATLESYVSILRKRLQPDRQARTSAVRTVSGGYAIDLDQVDVDLYRFEALARDCRAPGTPVERFTEALRLGNAVVLPDESDELVDEARLTHARAVQALRLAAVTAASVQGDHDAAIAWARVCVEQESLDEASWRALLTALGASGRPADALRTYEDCRRIFAEELGCAPGSALRDLQTQLLDQAVEDDEGLADALSAVLHLHTAATARIPIPRSSVLEARTVIGRLLHATA
jgi:SARP family transcriptional regulator, regulator of embCAB operon